MKLMRLTPQNIVVMEYVSDDVWLRWVREKDAQEWTQVTINPGTPYENKNQFGRIDVPFTVYKNTGDIFSTDNKGFQDFFSNQLTSHYSFRVEIVDMLSSAYFCFVLSILAFIFRADHGS